MIAMLTEKNLDLMAHSRTGFSTGLYALKSIGSQQLSALHNNTKKEFQLLLYGIQCKWSGSIIQSACGKF
jgi:hypothetical protein